MWLVSQTFKLYRCGYFSFSRCITMRMWMTLNRCRRVTVACQRQQSASTAGGCPSLLPHTPAGGKVKLKLDKERRRLKGKWWFDSILMKRSVTTRSCVGCVTKAHIYIWTLTYKETKLLLAALCTQVLQRLPLQATDTVMNTRSPIAQQ